MGYYIETPMGRDKAEYISKEYEGQIVSYMKARAAMNDETKGVIVVVHNSFFEAAGFAYNMREFEAFTSIMDPREKEFVILPREKAIELSGYVEYPQDLEP